MISAVLLTGCELGDFTLTDRATSTPSSASTGNSVSPILFPGIATIDNVTSQSVRLNWTNVSGAAVYSIYDATNGASPTYITAVNAPTAVYVVPSLTLATTYKFRVRLLDTAGAVDQNTNDVSVTTLAVTATHGGWTDLIFLRSKEFKYRHDRDANDQFCHNDSGRAWKANASGDSDHRARNAPNSVYCSDDIDSESGDREFGANKITVSTARSCGRRRLFGAVRNGDYRGGTTYVDTAVTGGNTYYYTLAAVVGGVVTPVTVSAFSEAKVIVPPLNMVLVHRWIANQEMCGQMGIATDPLHNYRCPYTGPGGAGGYFDLGASIFVDAYELGCNYTILGTATPGTGVGSSTAGSEDVFYNRATGICYIKTGASTWTQAKALTLSTAQKARMVSNMAGLHH